MTAVHDPINQSVVVLIPPHGGGSLVNRLLSPVDAKKIAAKFSSFPQISISSRTLSDIEMLAVGGFTPLQGFLNEADYESVVSKGRLANGTLWPIPINLAVDEQTKDKLRVGSPAALVHDDETFGIIHVESIYSPDKKREASQVYGTDDANHLGVAEVYNRGQWYVGGTVDVLALPAWPDFPQYNLTPRDVRRRIQQNKWRTVVGFQTRNPMHRGHEAIAKKALETVDGLLVHPMVGESKEGDIPPAVRMRCYEALLSGYFPAGKTLLAANPAHMYFAGPREAILHAIVRQNYGCTHFIVGRDHAGVGSYYGPADAQKLINWFRRSDLAIQPVFPESSVAVSGSQIREMLRTGLTPPADLMRPEVSRILIEEMRA